MTLHNGQSEMDVWMDEWMGQKRQRYNSTLQFLMVAINLMQLSLFFTDVIPVIECKYLQSQDASMQRMVIRVLSACCQA
jgi:hypothetical protein